MSHRKALIVGILLLSATVLITQSAFAADKPANMANASITALPDVKELVSFVDSAIAYARENGKEKALKAFNNKTGPFVKGDLYIFATDFNGTELASQVPNRVGKNFLNEMDPNGFKLINDINAVRNESEWFNYYIFPNPNNGNKSDLKLGYDRKVDDDWFLGSGIYLTNISATFDQKEKDDLVAYVNEALKFAKENGRQKAIEVFNDPKGNFTRDRRYIFAADYNGTSLALPFQTELRGKNLIDAKDRNGVKFGRLAPNIARGGNGFYYVFYPDPSRNMAPMLKLIYVTDVDGTWFLGSGIYAKGNETS